MSIDIKTELKPCPFCGGEAKLSSFTPIVERDMWAFEIFCKDCYCGTDRLRYKKDEAIEAWNSRVTT